MLLYCLLGDALWAYDFSAVVGGQTLYFNIVGGGVEVTYPNANAFPVNGWEGFTRPTGQLQIPSTVVESGVAYPVVSLGPLAFYGCTGLTSVVIGDGVSMLGNSAFNGCSLLSTVVIPQSVDSIGTQTFAYCPSLSQVWVSNPQPPHTSAFAFYNTTLTSTTLHVLPASLAAYSATAPWSSFGTLLGDGPRVTLIVGVNDVQRGTVTGGGLYNMGDSAVVMATAADGYSFICWNDGDMQNPRILTLTADRNLVAMFFALSHDTVVIHDTVPLTPTLYRLQVLSAQESMGVGVGSAEVPSGTEVEVCALPLNGGRFVGWSDGSNANPRRVRMDGDMELTAFFEHLSAEVSMTQNWHVRTEGRRVIVDGATGEKIRVYDLSGHELAELTATDGTVSLTLPAPGVYVVRVGEWEAVKVTVG